MGYLPPQEGGAAPYAGRGFIDGVCQLPGRMTWAAVGVRVVSPFGHGK